MHPPNGIPEPGAIFDDRFRIDGVLGEGGMGVVLSATHALMEMPVAIKMLHPALAGQPASVARFLREARNAAAIRSEHVGRVLDVARTEGGLPYIVMELMPGTDLSEVCRRRGALPVVEATAYILQVCVAVAEAHALGIVHRDLKPSNLFLTRRADGSPLVKVFDFGISKRSSEREDTATLTKTGMALGTPCYMAPEQITDARNVDERADVWSLGAILYELLTGKLPFEGDTAAAVMAAVSATRPKPVTDLRPEVPAGLGALVHQCLEKEPLERLPDVVALAEGLAPFAPDEYRSLAARVEHTRHPPPDKPMASGEAFRRALASAPTVVRSPPPVLVKASSRPPPSAPKRPRSSPPPAEKAAPDYARRAFGVAVYVAVLVTVILLARVLGWGDRPAAAPASSAREIPPLAVSPPPALTAAPATPVSAAPVTSTEPTQTPSSPLPSPSAPASVRPKASGSATGTKTKQVPDDFFVEP